MRTYRGANSPNRQPVLAPDAAILGAAQREWLKRALRASRKLSGIRRFDVDVNAVDTAGCSPDEEAAVEEAASANVKRVVRRPADDKLSPYAVTAYMEFKTVWHPIGV